jgi:hypothetical protein
MKLHIFSKTVDDSKGDLLGTIDANQTGLQSWEILEKLGVNPSSLKVEWCGDNAAHLAVCEVDAIIEVEMEVK